MNRTARIALVAHHANPELTSEPLIGWRWAKHLAPLVDLTLITHVRNRAAIEERTLDARVLYVDTERTARRVQRLNDWLFPDPGSLNRLLFETIAQAAFHRGATRLLRRLVRDDGVDVVHRVSPISPRYPTVMGRLGVPLVIGPVNGGMSLPAGFRLRRGVGSEAGLRLRGLARLLRWGSRSFDAVDRILVANERTRETLPIRHRDRARVLCENAVEDDLLGTPPERTEGPLRLLFLGRLVAYKGLRYLLQALARLDHERVVLDVVGDGRQRQDLEREARALGLGSRVLWHGAVPQHEVRTWLRKSHVLVLPSVRESGGAVVLEGMAAGLPVVVADHGGPVETVTPEAGIRVACGSPDELVEGLAHAISHLERNEDRRRRLGHNARARVEHEYTWTGMAARAVSLYRELARPKWTCGGGWTAQTGGLPS